MGKRDEDVNASTFHRSEYRMIGRRSRRSKIRMLARHLSRVGSHQHDIGFHGIDLGVSQMPAIAPHARLRESHSAAPRIGMRIFRKHYIGSFDRKHATERRGRLAWTRHKPDLDRRILRKNDGMSLGYNVCKHGPAQAIEAKPRAGLVRDLGCDTSNHTKTGRSG